MSAENGRFDLQDLLGQRADATARKLEEKVAYLLRRSFGRNPAVMRRADDIVQDVMTAAVRQANRTSRGESKPIRNPDAWLCRVTKNAAFKAYRQGRIERDSTSIEEQLRLSAPRELSPEKRLALRGALRRLDEMCRALLALVHVEGESYDSIAGLFEATAAALRVRAHRCRKKLLDLYLADAPAK